MSNFTVCVTQYTFNLWVILVYATKRFSNTVTLNILTIRISNPKTSQFKYTVIGYLFTNTSATISTNAAINPKPKQVSPPAERFSEPLASAKPVLSIITSNCILRLKQTPPPGSPSSKLHCNRTRDPRGSRRTSCSPLAIPPGPAGPSKL